MKDRKLKNRGCWVCRIRMSMQCAGWLRPKYTVWDEKWEFADDGIESAGLLRRDQPYFHKTSVCLSAGTRSYWQIRNNTTFSKTAQLAPPTPSVRVRRFNTSALPRPSTDIDHILSLRRIYHYALLLELLRCSRLAACIFLTRIVAIVEGIGLMIKFETWQYSGERWHCFLPFPFWFLAFILLC